MPSASGFAQPMLSTLRLPHWLPACLERCGGWAQAEEQLSSLAKLAMGMTNMVGEAVLDQNAGQSIDSLADELAGWMGLPAVPSKQAVLVIPEVVSSPPTPPPATS
jgi:hypothetical protein